MEYISPITSGLGSFFDYISKTPVLIGAIIAASIAIWGIITQRAISREKCTLDFEAKYKENNKVIESNQKIVAFLKETKGFPQAERLNAIKANEDIIKEIKNFLNEWERAAAACSIKLYDSSYLYKIFGSTVIYFYQELRPYIQYRQEANPRFYIQFTKLAVEWQIIRFNESAKSQLDKKLKTNLNVIWSKNLTLRDGQLLGAHNHDIKSLKSALKKINKIS